MNIGGLNSLGFIPQAKPAKGKASEKGETSSFDDVLAQTDRKDEQGDSDAAPAQIPLPTAKQFVQQPAKAQPAEVQATSVEGDSMPGQPSAPTLDAPSFNDRLMNTPVNAPVTAAVANKQPVPVAQDVEVDSLTRRAVWNDFLRKMKNDLGITAEDVLNAFQSLSDEELAQPPSQSVDKIVMALGLTGQDAQTAKQAFMDLVNKTRSGSMGEELTKSQKQISLTLMSQREVNRRNADRAVDQMQQKFFMNGAYPRPQEAVAANPTGQTQYIPKAVMDADGNVSYINPEPQQEPVIPVGTPMAPVQASPTATPNNVPVSKSINEAVAQMQPVESGKQSADVDSLVKKFMAGQAQPTRMAAASAAAPAAMVAVPTANMTASAPAASAASAMNVSQMVSALGGKEAATDDSQEFTEYTSDATYLGAMQGAEHGLKNSGPTEFQNQLNAVANPAQPMPVADLVQRAQVMVHDGGGEMKVTLAPDGLGEVAMRVSVKEGKVNVQMITESDEAKKLIERQLGDLKTSLISQNLHVDGIKVDTATNIGKQMEQQYHEAQRQMAQQTMEQFRQDQQGWRRSFFETPALKVYKGQGEAPRDIPTPTASSRSKNNRRLDLVA